MKIKTFNFPSFEEWRKKCKESEIPFSESYCYTEQIGGYRAEIYTSGWGYKANTYTAVLEHANVGNWQIFKENFYYNESEPEKLKEWYETVVVKINDRWKEYILQNYFDEVEDKVLKV